MAEERIPPKLRELLIVLREVYTPEGCGVWLWAVQKRWDGRSAWGMIEEGRIDEVLQAAHQLRDGAFA